MPALQYLNKEPRTAAGRRFLHEPRKPDLQRLSREARIQARKRLFGPVGQTGADTAEWLEDGFQLSLRALRSCVQTTAQFARRHPLPMAAGAVLGGLMIGLLLRRR